MSAASLPSYVAPHFSRSPSYTAEPQLHEQRLAVANGVRPRPSGHFVKESKSGGARLRLTSQENHVTLPVYGSNGSVEGTVEVSKPEGITSVEVKVEGRLRLHEIAAGGTTAVKLCLDTVLLWIKNPNNLACPPSLCFRLNLPTTFQYEGHTYPLPPTYDVKLDGLPGFTAAIDYSVTATLMKPNTVPLVKTTIFGISLGNIVLSTPFIYYPRTRPAIPPPAPLRPAQNGFRYDPEWQVYESIIKAKNPGMQDIKTKLYVPASRIFCLRHPIPFHLTLESSAQSLAAFLPYGPGLTTRRATRVQLMRQVTVDVRHAMISNTKTDIWRVDSIGEGRFRHAGDGPTWVSFNGDIVVDDSVKIVAFKAGGLRVKDCILFTMSPAEPSKSIFSPIRQVIPTRLTTDAWTTDGTGIGVHSSSSEYSVLGDFDAAATAFAI
ncbi:hypothetical protein ARMSODRAFT_951210 [Armillaria solidipes]|uniref:Arrestin-like N-terminal domain-containing protein n=1 Tax=Armillaria solidipes TaxID=1076256 RepID=A0A2H3C1H8_9AGAR|nr:hypothetical protein ARMSODRAFT_951210 [Armillaria solidipes]